MDYGKLAYMKVEELGARLSNSATEQIDEGGAYAVIAPYSVLTNGTEIPLTEIVGKGRITLVVKVTMRRDAAMAKGILTLKADGKIAALQSAVGEKGEVTYVLLTSVYSTGLLPLSLACEGNFDAVLIRTEVAALGSGLSLGRRQSDWSADYIGDGTKAAAAVVFDESVLVAPVTGGAIGAFASAGMGHTLDFAAVGTGFNLAYFDDMGNFWGVRYDSDLNELTRNYLGESGEDVSIGTYGEKLVVARLVNGKLYTRITDLEFGGGGDEVETDIGLRADKIRFVRHSNPPILTVFSDGIAYLKIPAAEYSSDKVFSLVSDFSITEVPA